VHPQLVSQYPARREARRIANPPSVRQPATNNRFGSGTTTAVFNWFSKANELTVA